MQLSRVAFIVPFVASLIGACGDPAQPPDDLLAGDQEVISVRTRSCFLKDSAAFEVLAIRKEILDSFWLSSTSFDGAAALSFAATEMVMLKPQNGRLFVFVSGPQPRSGVIDPPRLRASYPIVELPELGKLAGADRYVFIEVPAAPAATAATP